MMGPSPELRAASLIGRNGRSSFGMNAIDPTMTMQELSVRGDQSSRAANIFLGLLVTGFCGCLHHKPSLKI